MKNESSFIATHSLLYEYKQRYSYDKNFLTDEILRQVISRTAKMVIDRLIIFTENGLKASKALIDTFDPDPDSVPHDGDPIGLKGPCGGQIGWAGMVVYDEVKKYLEDVKNFL